jgi:cell division protein FtsI/penicillin-binding protein 2
VGNRRTNSLILWLLFGTLGIVARLAQVQLAEHAVWAEEARRLERSGEVLPYRRGAIRDARGRVLVADRSVYRLELDYRDFRRAHPLGVVTHARSTLEWRPVSMAEGLVDLEAWATALVHLVPGELHRFARGGPLAVRTVHLAESDEPAAEQRPARASDLRFYARALLAPTRSERAQLVKWERRPEIQQSYLELVAELRGLDPQDLLAARRAEWAAAQVGLEWLAERIDADRPRAAASGGGARRAPALERLVDEIEDWRRSVEEVAAARLFRDTLGFDVGRLQPELVRRHLDLTWLTSQLGWTEARCDQWLLGERSNFLRGWRDGFALPRILAELRLRADPDPSAELALDLCAALYGEPHTFAAALDGEPSSWREDFPLEVLGDLPTGLALPRGASQAVAPGLALPFQSPELRARTAAEPADFALLVELLGPLARSRLAAEFAAEPNGSFAREHGGDLARLWAAVAGRRGGRPREQAEQLFGALLDQFELQFAARAAEVLEGLSAAAGAQQGSQTRLVPAEDRLDRIGERARHLLRDYGSRRVVLVDEPSYEVVYLLTRDPTRYAGLVARTERERREGTAAGERELPGALLIGSVSAVDPELAQRQRLDLRELLELRQLGLRSEAEDARLRSLMRTVLLHGEDRGVSGVEAACDPWLRGHNGYRERLGLEDVYGRGAESISLTEVQDGADVWLCLDSALQSAATEVINEPELPPPEVETDVDWFRSPVGAIVLCTVDGRLLAAASAPDGAAVRAGAEDEGRAAVVDRTLRVPTFQPLGSVFKPFVALYALDRGLVSTGFTHVCAVPEGDTRAGYGGVRCNSRFGHGEVDLARALAVSCNSYFARLADFLAPEDFEELGRSFGFGLPTGVVFEGAASGLGEHSPAIFQWNPSADLARQQRRATNGLQVVEVTPVQVARAMAALASGRLPALRLVDRIGEQTLPQPPAVQLPYGPAQLAFVQRALVGVTNDREGSARRTLSRQRLGVTVAAKTGSADLQHRSAAGADGEGLVLKHTWVAGWLPAEDPELVFVTFLSTTEVSSSYAAIYVAAQLLSRPEVRAYLAERGHALEPLGSDEDAGQIEPSEEPRERRSGGVR